MTSWLQPFADRPDFRIAISSIEQGNLSLRYGQPDQVLAARRRWWGELGLSDDRVVPLSLDASYGVHWIDSSATELGVQAGPNADGAWLTDGRALFMVVADCYPVAFFDSSGAIGLFHAGRADLGAGLLEDFLDLASNHGLDLASLRVFIGPGICRRHYDFEQPPANYQRMIERGEAGRYGIDLRRDVRETLLRTDINQKFIVEDLRCTFESDQLFSHRRDRGSIERRFGIIVTSHV